MIPIPKITSQKMCLIGDFGVGKTSLIRQFVDRQFSDQYLSTVGVKISRKIVCTDKNPQQNSIELSQNIKQLQLVIWDIEGSTRFKAIAPSYLQGARGALIVGDVTRSSSLENLKNHIQLFQSVNPKSCAIVALNKIDLIDPHEQERLLQSIVTELSDIKISIYMTSAKSGVGVGSMFQTLAQQILMLK
ncbi:MAG: GTP-binding protein [Oscillatoriales cyanobacterium CG2_30_44_21]|nr:MAG: GTP-binding protein [Oscillatoriales cyanobacterium CG2_30_44_21]